MSPSPRFRLPWRTRATIDAEVDEEVRFHLDMRTEELMESGLSRDEASARALREFGDVSGARREMGRLEGRAERDRRTMATVAALRQDTAFAVRTLWRARSFAAVAVLTLAVGIGATTAIFSVVNGVLLRPLPFAEPDRSGRGVDGHASERVPDGPGERDLLQHAGRIPSGRGNRPLG